MIFAILLTCVIVSSAQDYSKTTVYSFNDRVDFVVESCIRDASSNRVTIVYYLQNNTGKSYTMQWIGAFDNSTQSYCAERATRFVDNLGNEYKNFMHQIGSKDNSMSVGGNIQEVVLIPGVLVKGELTIMGVSSNARSLQLVNIGFDSRIQDNSLGTVCRSYGIRNIPLYTLAEFAEFENQRQIKEAQVVLAKAEQGDNIAQYEMGNRYMEGKGVMENPATAFEWYHKSATQNNIQAIKAVGDCYYYGNGIGEDFVEALEWYEKSANLGNTDARAMVGYILAVEHKGITNDKTKGIQYLENAALSGSTTGKSKLGILLYAGVLDKPDYENALSLLSDAAELGEKEAQFYLGLMYDWGRGINQNSAKAAEWFHKSAAQGFLLAENLLGSYYVQGRGVEQNIDKGIELMEKAAAGGIVYAYNYLGDVYFQDKYGRKNLPKAVSYWKQAADQGDATGLSNMGFAYHLGLGVLKNPQIAIEYFEKAAELGEVNAQYQLGVIYKGANNLSKSFTWFQKAADNGNNGAQYEVGLMYYYGKGTTKNTKKAAYYIEKAHSTGHKEAAKIWNELELWKYK